MYTDTVEEEGARLYVVRSSDSGASWGSPQWLGSTYGGWSAMAGSGTDVDVAWWEEHLSTDSTLFYRHSFDSGATFSAPIALAVGDPSWVSLARRGDVVALLAGDGASTMPRMYVSTDGGASFHLTADLGVGSYHAVAVGDGVIYAAYFVDDTHIDVRRSLNSGDTWLPAVEIAADGYSNANLYAVSLTASADHAYLAYSAKSATSEWVRYVRTIDKGATWSATADLSSPSGHRSLSPRIYLKAGVVRVVFEECLVSSCNRSVVTYRESSNGTTWTDPETASTTSTRWTDLGGVGVAGRVIVLYRAAHGRDVYTCACDLYVSTR